MSFLEQKLALSVLCSLFATSWRRIWLNVRGCAMMVGISDCPGEQTWFPGRLSCPCPAFGPTRKGFLLLIKSQEICQENGVSWWARSVPWSGCMFFLSKVYSLGLGQQWPCMYDWCVCVPWISDIVHEVVHPATSYSLYERALTFSWALC